MSVFEGTGFRSRGKEIAERNDLATIGDELVQEPLEQLGLGAAFRFGMDGEHVEIVFPHARSKMVVEVRVVDSVGADRFVPGGEIDADLGWSVRWLEDTVSAAIAGEAITESLAKGEDFGRAAPAGGGGTGRRQACGSAS